MSAIAVFAAIFVVLPASASAGEPTLAAIKNYPGLTTFQCHTDPITIYPGQNTNDLALTQTCPHAVKLNDGPVDPAVFAPGSQTKGFVTRFKPSMVELHPDGSTTTPAVWDCLLYTSPSPRDGLLSRMPSSA